MIRRHFFLAAAFVVLALMVLVGGYKVLATKSGGAGGPAAMAREFREEAEIVVTPEAGLQLHGFFLNPGALRRDHIAVYVVPAFTVTGPKQPDREIAEAGFFPLDALPADTTRATRARLAEIRGGQPPAELW